MHQGFAGLVLSRAHIKLPAMPGAGNDAALQLAFAEWAPLMRANAIEGVNGSIHVE